jgi:hypothetical protein
MEYVGKTFVCVRKMVVVGRYLVESSEMANDGFSWHARHGRFGASMHKASVPDQHIASFSQELLHREA